MAIAQLYSKGITLAEGMPRWQAAFIKLYDDIKQIVPAAQGRKTE